MEEIEHRSGHRVEAWSLNCWVADIGGTPLSETVRITGLVVAETRCGPAVEELLHSDCTVFPVQPKAAARYREHKAPSGVKDDLLDTSTTKKPELKSGFFDTR